MDYSVHVYRNEGTSVTMLFIVLELDVFMSQTHKLHQVWLHRLVLAFDLVMRFVK